MDNYTIVQNEAYRVKKLQMQVKTMEEQVSGSQSVIDALKAHHEAEKAELKATIKRLIENGQTSQQKGKKK